MNRFVPSVTTTFQPMAFYTPQPMMVAAQTRPYGALALGATEFGAAKKKDDKKKSKGKKKGKKKESGFKKFLKTSGKAVGALAKEGASDLLKKKTGIDVTTPAEGEAGAGVEGGSGESYEAGSGGDGGGEETKKSNTPLIVGGVLAALLLAGGGFYLYSKKKKAGGAPAPAPAAAV